MHLFNVFNNYFDKIWVLSLETATNRRAHIQTHLQGLNFSFFNAVDKTTLSEAELIASKVYDKVLAQQHERYSKPMGLGQIACALSHKKMYETIVSNGYSKTLILEDDVQPILAVAHEIDAIMAALPTSWELVYFDYARNIKANYIKQYWYHVQHALGGLKWSHKIIKNLYATSFNKHVKVAGFHDYTDAYAITLEGAKKLMAIQTPVAYVADNLLAHACSNKHIEAYITVPQLFLQTSQGENASLTSSVH